MMILPRYAIFAAMLAAAGLPIYIHAPKFYVDEYGVSLAQIGTALLLLRFLDAIQDPLLGRLAARLTRQRPLAAGIGTAGLTLGMTGLFAVIPPIPPLLWMSLCLTLLFTSYSFLSILFYAQGITQAERLGEDGHIRLAGWRETGSLIGVSAATIAPFVIGAAGSHTPFTGYALLFVPLAALAALSMAPMWNGPLGNTNFGFTRLLGNHDIRRLLILAIVNTAPVAVTSTLFLFFVEYRLGQPALAGPLLLAFFVSAACAAPLWARAARRFDASSVLATGMALSIAAFIAAYSLDTGQTGAFLLICIASGAALGADMTLLPAIFAARTATLNASGGEAFGLWNFSSKLSLALAAALVLPLLEAGGFTPGAQNSDTALARLSVLYALVPCALKLAALLLLTSMQRKDPIPCPNR